MAKTRRDFWDKCPVCFHCGHFGTATSNVKISRPCFERLRAMSPEEFTKFMSEEVKRG